LDVSRPIQNRDGDPECIRSMFRGIGGPREAL
jgi:hypothetical protein